MYEEEEWTPMATMADAHREWHSNAGVPMGQPGCPWDACDGDPDPMLDEDSSEYGKPEAGSWPDDMKRDCDLCGEEINWTSPLPSKSEAGEFWDPEKNDSVIAHAQCGLDAGLELA